MPTSRSRTWFAISALFATVAWSGVFQLAGAAIIATYSFPGADPAGDLDAPAAAHATFGSFSRTNVTQVSLNDQFASTNYTSAAAIDLGEYVEFTVTANSGYQLDLESLAFKHTRQDHNANRTGPQNGAVRASFEAYAAGSGTGSAFSPITSQTTSTWDFADFSTADGGSATFRFYGWNSLGTASTSMRLLLDDVTLFGAITAVPPPGTPPTVDNTVVNNVVRGDLVTRTVTANEPDGDIVNWSGFTFSSYTPAYGGVGTGSGADANFNYANQEFTWNAHGPRGIYEWLVDAGDKDGSDQGSIVVHVTAVPEPATLGISGLAALALCCWRRSR
jgi:hypothetical protein